MSKIYQTQYILHHWLSQILRQYLESFTRYFHQYIYIDAPVAFRVKGFHSVCSFNDYCFNARRYSYLSLHLNHNLTTSTFYCGPESVRHSASVNLNSHGTKELPRKRSNLRNVKIQLVRYPAKDKQREI